MGGFNMQRTVTIKTLTSEGICSKIGCHVILIAQYNPAYKAEKKQKNGELSTKRYVIWKLNKVDYSCDIQCGSPTNCPIRKQFPREIN